MNETVIFVVAAVAPVLAAPLINVGLTPWGTLVGLVSDDASAGVAARPLQTIVAAAMHARRRSGLEAKWVTAGSFLVDVTALGRKLSLSDRVLPRAAEPQESYPIGARRPTTTVAGRRPSITGAAGAGTG
jgi:hypothetical protein